MHPVTSEFPVPSGLVRFDREATVPAGGTVAHHFTVDVEEYFQVSAFERTVAPHRWDGFESRVVPRVEELLELMDTLDARGTFFVLGWVAQRHPDLVRTIARAGHEVASHGWDHRRVTRQSRAEFRASVRRSKQLLEELTGLPVLGFRAPSFSIVPGREWALDELLETGYAYDSSLFPVRRPGYGYPGAQRFIHRWVRPAGILVEVPPATLRVCGCNLPAAGGAYLRHFPVGLVSAALRAFGRRGEAGTVYVHPWEWDAGQPRLPAGWLTRVRHYGGLETTWRKMQTLLREFRFVPIADTLGRRVV